MIKAYIRIDNPEAIQKLYRAAHACKYKLVVECGSIRINPKSLIGIFSVAMHKTLSLIGYTNDRNAFIESFGEFFNYEDEETYEEKQRRLYGDNGS